MSRAQQHILTFGVACVSRVCIWRDRILGRIARDERAEFSAAGIARHSIRSGSHVLDAVFAVPASGPAQASLLICHGIGETVEHWLVVQQLLACRGVASLVFDYSGFGRSAGPFNANQAEQDAIAAFLHLEKLTAPLPVSVLGLSLGSGIAAAVMPRVPVHRLFLCAAFTSLRKGAVSIALPRFLGFLLPDIWDSRDALRTCSVPVVVVQGDEDRLFPVRMAADLVASCASPAELVVVPRLSHNQPFYRPQFSYWDLIVSRLLPGH